MEHWLTLRKWLTQSALPLWPDAGFNPSTELFTERLTLDSRPIYTVPHRLMVQARQIFFSSMAEQYGWNHKAGELVSRGARNMVKSYYEADGKPEWIMSILPSGGVFDSSRDLYAHAFVLFGLAAAFRSTEDERFLRLADTTLMFLDSSMVYHSGGYLPVLLCPEIGPNAKVPHALIGSLAGAL